MHRDEETRTLVVRHGRTAKIGFDPCYGTVVTYGTTAGGNGNGATEFFT